MPSDPKDTPSGEREYVLGTHREEVERLGLQHRLWRDRVLESWERAGFGPGQTLVDVGSGPGHASFDLAEITGPEGRVVAVDQSARFLEEIRARAKERGVASIETHACDVTRDEIPARDADGAWVRWVLCFVTEPRTVLERIVRAVKPGGTIVLLDYFDYESWRFARETPAHDRFREAVVASWRGDGGNPDVGLEAPRWLREMGCEVVWMRTVTELIRPADPLWQWAATFIRSAGTRLVQRGFLTAAEDAASVVALEAAEADPEALMVTPGVVQIVARRPS
jgi:SAM-dependent methyltransferase